jgi:AhpC/TSA family
MKIHRRHALLGLAGMAAASRLSAAIAVGDKAPEIELPSTQDKTEKISAYRGKKNVVVAFYPKAFTGG